MASTKRAETINKEKEALRQHIADIQMQISSINKIPPRVLNGSHQEAVGWKRRVDLAQSQSFRQDPPRNHCTLKRLAEIKDDLSTALHNVAE